MDEAKSIFDEIDEADLEAFIATLAAAKKDAAA